MHKALLADSHNPKMKIQGCSDAKYYVKGNIEELLVRRYGTINK